jgi:hypothetical protein
LVVEGKPIAVRLLNPKSSAWRFTHEMPSIHQNGKSRRWFVQDKTRMQTGVEDDVTFENWKLPDGISLWHASEDARRLLILAKYDARELLASQKRQSTLPCNDEWHTLRAMTLFDTPGHAELCFRESVVLMQAVAPYLARIAKEYAKSLCWIYGMQPREFDEGCRMHVRWCEAGYPMSLPNASSCRFENGPIVHASIGLPVVHHDLAPTLTDLSETENPVRISVPEGMMVCLDGASRIRYSHGHPAIPASKDAWFSLIFFLDCTKRSMATSYERQTRAVVMKTPVLSERVVTSRPEVHRRVAGVEADMTSLLIRGIRHRLRAMESHQMASRYLSIGTAENSSASSSKELL